jgi:hypothetical protein
MEGCMKRVVASVLVLLGWAVAARASDFRSSFGFTLSVPDDWLVLTKEAIKDNPALADPQPSGAGSIDSNVLKDLVAKVQSGSIEFLYNRTTSDATFSDNINVRLGGQGMIPSSPEAVEAQCTAYAQALAKAVGRRLSVAKCEDRSVEALKAFYVEYEGRVAGTVTMQYQLVRPDNKMLFVTATCKRATLDTFRSDFEAIVKSIRFV